MTWPALPLESWKDTYATLHMWTQIVGKIALAQAPPLNHCWGAALALTDRGFSTPLLPYDHRSFAIEFDFVDHQLRLRTTDGEERTLALEPRTVADLYREVTALLAGLRMPVEIWPMPVEVPAPIRFDQDTVHRAYDPDAANRCWRILVGVGRVLVGSRARFLGKSSALNFWWGSFDVAVTRFSGRPAPPREGPAFMCDAYSHEVISHGFWPGSGPVQEPALYGYAVPEPAALKDARIQPEAAYYHRELGEFILPYEAVRTSVSPEAAIRAFVDSTYDAAATLGKWDRAALERGGSKGPGLRT